jgi:hypothetical protein
MFLLYIVVGIAEMALFGRAAGGEDTAARLASIAQHAAMVRLSVLLTLHLDRGVPAVALYALTRALDRDRDDGAPFASRKGCSPPCRRPTLGLLGRERGCGGRIRSASTRSAGCPEQGG